MTGVPEYCEDDGHHDWEAMGYGDRRCSKCGVTDYAESEEDLYKRIYGETDKPKNDIREEQ